MARTQDAPPREPRPGMKWIKTTKVVNGFDTEEWTEVPDVAGLAWPAREDMRLLNKDLQRIDGPDKVTGRARYTHDVRLPGMLYARLLLSPHPAGSVEIDTAPALAIRGVEDARTIGSGRISFLGQAVAAVAAKTPELADDALRALAVTWRPEPFAVTADQASAEGAPAVGQSGNVRAGRPSGDADETALAFEMCEAIVEAEYTIPVQHHASLETHGVVVDYRGGDEATVYASTQGTFSVDDAVSEPLGLDGGAVTTIVEHMGGGFGAKLQFGVEGQLACQLARDLKRPVHLMLTRSDEFLIGGNRSGSRQRVKAGASRAGELIALESDVDRLGGVQRGSHPGLPYVYRPAVHSHKVQSILTHTDGSRAFRAPGHPQASFAMESVMDELAYAIAMDPLEFRKRNLPEETADTYRRQLDRCAAEIGWNEHPHRTAPRPVPSASDGPVEGIGFGVATWGGGGRPACEVEVRLRADGGVTVLSGTQDLGTGTRTYVAAIVAEELGLPLDAVTARIGDSRFGRANSSGGSTTAASLAPAVKDAASKALRALCEQIAAAVGWSADSLTARDGAIVDRSDPLRSIPWAEACEGLGPDGLTARGTWQNQLASSGTQGAQAARVSVDPRTGEVRVVRMVSMHNCGLVLNTLATRSQIHGGMIQALSYGLFEERVIDPDLGVMLNANFDDYKLAGPREMPEFNAMLDETDTRGVIGIGEPPIIPGHSAIANAVHNACGVRVRSMPLTPDKVLAGLVAAREGGGR